MMTEGFCTLTGKREDLLMSYLYDDITPEARAQFERHLAACAVCRTELEAFRGVRAEVREWAAPELAEHVSFTPSPVPSRPRWLATLRDIPAWAQVAAAMLFLGAAAGLANLDVNYTAANGLSVRTGWRQSVAAPGRTSAIIAPAPANISAPMAPAATPWRTDLVALETELRAAIDEKTDKPSSDDVVMRRVAGLILDSERRQQRDLALHLAEAMQDLQLQRQADLVKMERSLGIVQSRTGIEVMRTQRQVNSLAQQVSQRP